MTDPM